MPKNKRFRIAVDFDGTLNKRESDYPFCYTPNKRLFKKLIKARKKGHKVILWTLREGSLLERAVIFCKENGLEFDKVNESLDEDIKKWCYMPRKVCADLYIDDRNCSIRKLGRLI